MDPYNYAYYQYEFGNDAYGDFEDLDIWKSIEGRDYQDEVFGRTGFQKLYNVNVSGGLEGSEIQHWLLAQLTRRAL